MKNKRRVVITGMGVCSSLGGSETEIRRNFQQEKVCFVRPDFDPEVVVSPVSRFDIKNDAGPFKDRRYLSRGGELAAAAAIQAVQDAGPANRDLSDMGLFLGAGPNMDLGCELPEIHDGHIADKGLKALWMLRFLPNTPASVISKMTGVHGENAIIATACAASLQAIGEAFRKIRDGYVETALAGGGDSRISPGGILGFKKAGALYKGEGPPDTVSRPFDQGRSGFVAGEGGAMFVMESLSSSQVRGARIYAEIAGYGASMDGYAMTAPDPEGIYAEKAVRQAMADARTAPERIDLVSTHGTGTILNDDMEAALLGRLFIRDRPLVIALKSWIGHTATACGALELALSLVCMKNGFIPGIRNLENPCHERVQFVMANTRRDIHTLLLENFGFGGQNAAIIVHNGGHICP